MIRINMIRIEVWKNEMKIRYVDNYIYIYI